MSCIFEALYVVPALAGELGVMPCEYVYLSAPSEVALRDQITSFLHSVPTAVDHTGCPATWDDYMRDGYIDIDATA